MKLDLLTLERHQLWLYLAAIVAGLTLGSSVTPAGDAASTLIWPALGGLLYATFLQVPISQLRRAFTQRRFLAGVVLGNFVCVPALVWAILPFLPDEPALRLGVLLVLLVPCTDWFIAFSQLGGGRAESAVAVTPLNLLLQLVLLPVYLWLMLGAQLRQAVTLADVWPAAALVLGALLLAAFSGKWLAARRRACTAWLPVPLLAVVLFLVAAAQVPEVLQALAWLPALIAVYAAFLFLTALMARVVAAALRLDRAQGRTLAFSMGTRNSFVVLPFALGLPAGWELTAVVIVVQSLVELFGMLVYLWWIPNRLFAR